MAFEATADGFEAALRSVLGFHYGTNLPDVRAYLAEATGEAGWKAGLWREQRGPNSFDCIGVLVWASHLIGRGDLVGDPEPWGSAGGTWTVPNMASLFAGRSSLLGRRGDFIVWGDWDHIGFYLGAGMAISCMPHGGVQVHPIDAAHVGNLPVRAFLHTGLTITEVNVSDLARLTAIPGKRAVVTKGASLTDRLFDGKSTPVTVGTAAVAAPGVTVPVYGFGERVSPRDGAETHMLALDWPIAGGTGTVRAWGGADCAVVIDSDDAAKKAAHAAIDAAQADLELAETKLG